MKERITVKIGSQILTRKDGTLDVTRMSALVDQIAELHKNGTEVILVSSGAVASGKMEIKAKAKLDTISARQLYSSIGQVKLINRYSDLFHQQNIICGQILATKEDFSTRRHYLNQRNCMSVMLDNKVIPIVNENDAISVTGLMFTDNDEMSGLVAAMMGCKKLIILSNIDGIYNGDPSDKDSKIFREIDIKKDNIEDCIQSSKSSTGRGGMTTKYNIARKAAEEGIEVIIANGRRDNILIDLMKRKDVVSTHFVPSAKKTTSVKKWIAHSEGFTKGEIYVNKCAREVLLGDKAVSLLPVGVTKISGNFEADDVVRIIDETNGKQIGIGKAAYNSEKAKEVMGKSNKKAIIHYDYLYIEK
jgi:glutamate 5-kinase